MSEPRIEPHKITKPIQLLAVWLAALVLLVGAFLTAAATVNRPLWLAPTFGIAAVAIVPLFLTFIFVMQTRFRAQLQEDPYYADYLKRQEVEFKNFRPENVQTSYFKDTSAPPPPAVSRLMTDADYLERQRIKRYENNAGLFLVHTWRPSLTPGQVADIAIRLHQHGDGPLKEGKVKSVEYELGPKFFHHPVIKTNAADAFRLDVSAYGPMLCLAKVHFKDGQAPLLLERYIDF